MRASLTAFAAVVVFSFVTIALADDPATEPADPTAIYSARIDKLLPQLGATSPIDAEAAEIGLALLPPKAFPLIEAAAKKPGLTPEASARLKRLIDRQTPWQEARLRLEKYRHEAWIWNRDTALKQYDAVGTKDPKWDADARKAIELFVMPANYVRATEVRRALDKAIADGCKDPLVWYFSARRFEMENPTNLAEIANRYGDAAGLFTKSQYSAFRQIVCYAACYDAIRNAESARLGPGQQITGKPVQQLAGLLQRVGKLAPQLAGEKLPPQTLIDVTDSLLAKFAMQRKKLFDLIYAPLEKAAPDDTYTLTVKGKFYITYAWDARGNGWANTVTEQGFADMKDRLVIADEALTKAWEKDHGNFEAARAMLRVELGQGQGRNRMELWFNRAMEANPDDQITCLQKLYYLEPKWYGKPEDMLIFGRQCVETRNWRGDIPVVLAERA